MYKEFAREEKQVGYYCCVYFKVVLFHIYKGNNNKIQPYSPHNFSHTVFLKA